MADAGDAGRHLLPHARRAAGVQRLAAADQGGSRQPRRDGRPTGPFAHRLPLRLRLHGAVRGHRGRLLPAQVGDRDRHAPLLHERVLHRLRRLHVDVLHPLRLHERHRPVHDPRPRELAHRAVPHRDALDSALDLPVRPLRGHPRLVRPRRLARRHVLVGLAHLLLGVRRRRDRRSTTRRSSRSSWTPSRRSPPSRRHGS